MNIDFDEFVRTHTARLRAIVARMPGRGDTEVDDLVQEALARAYEKRNTFVSEQHALNWACHVVRCLLVDEQRSWYRRNVVANPDAADTVPAGADPADLVARSDDCRLAVRSLAGLPVAHRQLLWDHVVEGESYADIARRTATPLATVRSTAHRARAAAQRHFRQAGGLLAGVTVPLRVRWSRLRLPAVPAESLAAGIVAASALLAGTPGAASALPVAVPPVSPYEHVVATAEPERPVALAVHEPDRRAPAAPARRPARQQQRLARDVRFTGTWSSQCSQTPYDRSLLYQRYDYECSLTASSTTCVSATESVTLECQLTLTAAYQGFSERWADALDLGDVQCRAAGYDTRQHRPNTGEVEYVDAPGAPPLRVPVRIVPSHTTIAFSGQVKVGERWFMVGGNLPFSCEETVTGASGFKGNTHY